jgi:tetratricopeptide (TPR) repeat protein
MAALQTIVRRFRPPMETIAHNLTATRGRQPSLAVAEAVVESLLTAHKAGSIDDWLRRRRRIGRWLSRHWLRPVLGTAGDGTDAARPASAVALLLRWAVGQQRPDRAGLADPIARDAWLERTSWRPPLAVACQYGFIAVPAFRDRYRSHPDEAAASQLCGLWAVGGSTYYRYLDKGKRALAQCLRDVPAGAEQRLSLRAAAMDAVAGRRAAATPDERQAWHARQAHAAQLAGDSVSALWHLARAGDTAGVTRSLQRHSVELANEAETDAIVDGVAAAATGLRERFELEIARAALARMRGDAQRELGHFERALRLAADADDALLLGIVYGALGKYHEPRDLDRAFAYYHDSAECLRRSGVGDGPDSTAEVLEAYVATLVRLAWLYALRNDPRARALLERAQAVSGRHALAPATLAMLEQTWGECLRRAGDLPRALEHKHRALLLYERIDDRQAILKTCGNLSLIYGEAKNFERAREYAQRVLALAGTMTVEPEILASTHMNLGVAWFWQADYARARDEYQHALDIAMRHRLHRVAGLAHYNLAEVAYLQFKQSGDALDEQRGDAHAAAAIAIWPHESDPTHGEATRRLKRDILGPPDDRARDRLLPAEAADHFAEVAEVQRQRERLALPGATAGHVRAHLAIARAYLAIAMKEREAALTLIAQHGLGDGFAAELQTLRDTFERELTREQKLVRHWREATADLLNAQRCQAVLAELLRRGALNKSGYAELCALSPATASKHLVTLAERGLLVQTGKGPATRYTLPA